MRRKSTLLQRIEKRSKKECAACYKHHSVPHLKGAYHIEK